MRSVRTSRRAVARTACRVPVGDDELQRAGGRRAEVRVEDLAEAAVLLHGEPDLAAGRRGRGAEARLVGREVLLVDAGRPGRRPGGGACPPAPPASAGPDGPTTSVVAVAAATSTRMIDITTASRSRVPRGDVPVPGAFLYTHANRRLAGATRTHASRGRNPEIPAVTCAAAADSVVPMNATLSKVAGDTPTPSRGRVAAYSWFLLTAVAIAVFAPLPYLTDSLANLADGQNVAANYADRPLWAQVAFYVHIVGGGAALLLSPLQFAARLRRRAPRCTGRSAGSSWPASAWPAWRAWCWRR